MIAWLEARAWQVGAIAASAAALSLSVALVASKISEHRLTTRLHEIQASIDDPHTGYVVRLSQCRTNLETVSGELGRQNDAIKRQSEDSAKRIAEAEKSLVVAHAATAEEKGFRAANPILRATNPMRQAGAEAKEADFESKA